MKWTSCCSVLILACLQVFSVKVRAQTEQNNQETQNRLWIQLGYGDHGCVNDGCSADPKPKIHEAMINYGNSKSGIYGGFDGLSFTPPIGFRTLADARQGSFAPRSMTDSCGFYIGAYESPGRWFGQAQVTLGERNGWCFREMESVVKFEERVTGTGYMRKSPSSSGTFFGQLSANAFYGALTHKVSSAWEIALDAGLYGTVGNEDRVVAGGVFLLAGNPDFRPLFSRSYSYVSQVTAGSGLYAGFVGQYVAFDFPTAAPANAGTHPQQAYGVAGAQWQLARSWILGAQATIPTTSDLEYPLYPICRWSFFAYIQFAIK